MKGAIFFLLLLLSCPVKGQLMQYDYGYKKMIQIRLLNEKIVYNELGFNLKVSITNKTDTTFLLYELKDVEDGWWSGRSTYMEPNNGTGSVIFILDENRKQLKLKLIDELLDKYESHYTPVPLDSIEERFYKSRIIIPAKGTSELVVPITPKVKASGERDKLPKGEFTLSFLYYSGQSIINVIPKERILDEEKKYNALTYQGYVQSNTVKLIVK